MTRRVRLALLGDLMLGRGVSRALRHRSPEWFWGDVLPILRQADAVFANLEAPITASSERGRHGWKMFHFRADPAAVGILTCANVRFVCLANNHILDFGERGLLDTVHYLDAAGIRYAGAGRNAVEAAAPSVVDLPGLKVGLIAATDNMRAFSARPDRPGTNFIDITADSAGLDWINSSVAELRRAGATLIMLSLHWGPNMRLSPNRAFRRFARAAVDRGVDIVHGHSAHVVQAVERYRRAIILYDTGNFIDDYWKFPFRRTVWSFVFFLDIEDGRPTRLRLAPVHIHSSPVELATGDTSRAIKEHMKSLCAALGTPVVDTPEGLEVRASQ
jgi:poly-gamma-glutamate capsule biosynthesis protein CapA/YwtB (metallophosphatase superfamily)